MSWDHQTQQKGLTSLRDLPSLCVELVRESQVVILLVVTNPRVRRLRGIWVYRGCKVLDKGYLTRRVDTTEIVASIRPASVGGQVVRDGIGSKQTQKAEQEDAKTADVEQAAKCEDGAAVILCTSAPSCRPQMI